MNPAAFYPSAVDYLRFLPELILTIGGVLLLILEALTGDNKDKTKLGYVAIAIVIGAMFAVPVALANPGLSFNGMIVSDGFAAFFRMVTLLVGLFTLLCSTSYLSREKANTGEFYLLVLFSLAGQGIMVASNELIMVFLGLEIASISSYVLAGFLRDDKRGSESALKYFLLGSFATAFLLYGISWIYGVTGATNLTAIRDALAAGTNAPSMVVAAAALMMIGLAFKVSAAPFQVWAPDVYQGAPAPVSGFLSAGPKAAAFAIFLRIFQTSFESLSSRYEPVLWILALATMLVGNFSALWQSNVKRMLAYSSIAHAGYVLVAVTSNSNVGTAAAMFYLAAYALMNFGAFAAITHLAGRGESHVTIDDLKGLASKQPVLAGLLTVCLLSLTGVPLTAGFFGKFYIFKAAIDNHLYWLSALGLLNSAIAAYYYLRVLAAMYMQEPKTTDHPEPVPGGIQLTMWFSAAGILTLGVFPGLVLDYANRFATFVK
jgi:NADH-quinone oxidoreductase subunit N